MSVSGRRERGPPRKKRSTIRVFCRPTLLFFFGFFFIQYESNSKNGVSTFTFISGVSTNQSDTAHTHVERSHRAQPDAIVHCASKTKHTRLEGRHLARSHDPCVCASRCSTVRHALPPPAPARAVRSLRKNKKISITFVVHMRLTAHVERILFFAHPKGEEGCASASMHMGIWERMYPRVCSTRYTKKNFDVVVRD